MDAATRAATSPSNRAVGTGTLGATSDVHRGLHVGQDATPAGVSQALEGAFNRDVLITVGGKSNMRPVEMLQDEIRRLGASPRLAMWKDLSVDGGQLIHQGQPTPLPDAIIARGANERSQDILRELEGLGVHAVNRADAIRQGRSKLDMVHLFDKWGVPAPESTIVRSSGELMDAADVHGLPLIVKLDRSAGGQGVFLARTRDDVASLGAEHLAGRNPHPIVAQTWFPEGNRDIRLTVIRDAASGENQLTSAFQRIGNDFRANGPLGNRTERIPLSKITPDEHDIALRASNGPGLDVTGVDLMRTSRGPKVIEINTTPGIPELDATLPRHEHAIPRIAEYAVYGRRG